MKRPRSASPRKPATRGAAASVKPEVGTELAPASKDLQREQFEYYLSHFAQYDALTELPNRGQFLDRLAGAVARATRNGQILGLMLLNIDSFKAVNFKHGHRCGDLVLKQVAERLKLCTRKSDTLARLGGDEFAVILEGLASKDVAPVPAQRAIEALSGPLAAGVDEIRITVTIGISVYPLDARDVDGLLRAADAAMCDAKDNQRHTYRLHSPELEVKTRRDELRRAEVRQKLARLTPREREVLDILVAGKANKMIAYLLGTSTRTIENHRASIMDKMQANSLPELVRMVLDHQGPAAINPVTPVMQDR